ncbi:MAG: DNA repair exonuclease [Candidatus Methanoperedens sp.]|nr:DNA repair exonuclease [Candidatus Methanoperedens sp.]
MSLKIFLTSDLHLGMKFAGYPKVQSELTEARFATLENLVQRANHENCNLFVVAGDLFDRVSIAKSNIIRAAQILSEFQGNLVTVLPGNHDFIIRGQNDLWAIFKESSGDNVKILGDRQIEPLHHYDLDVHLYPAPCEAKHSDENHINWIKELPKNEDVTFHIGVAHGSLEGFSPDFDKEYYPMTVSELNDCKLDIWLIGHTHSQYPVRPSSQDRIFYPATPEPDGFDCMHDGKAWIIEMDETKRINPSSLTTGTYRFQHGEAELNRSSDVETLLKKYSSNDYKRTLLKLKLKGRLPTEEYKRLPCLKENIEEQLFYIHWDDADIFEKITQDIIDKEFTEGSFPHKLLSSLADDIEDVEALQIAYDLINEVKQ